ncbi:glycosyltransferase involved in cell wall biosynthesis [Microbacterium sp. ZKA21]|uniref:glycosyltransferase n=1 Tax=Microbacterium sp. ZKA21 TaxID=3381694 RepID=UPI003D220A1F
MSQPRHGGVSLSTRDRKFFCDILLVVGGLVDSHFPAISRGCTDNVQYVTCSGASVQTRKIEHMIRSGDAATARRWHTNDFLIRLANGEEPTSSAADVPAWASTDTSSSAGASFGVPSLSLVAGDAPRHEQLSVLRNDAWEDRTLEVFGARTRSRWALDVLVGRATHFGHDWASLRAAGLAGTNADGKRRSPLDSISVNKLFALVETLHERGIDREAEKALLSVIAERFINGESLGKSHQSSLAVLLVQNGLIDQARLVSPLFVKDTWLTHAVSVQLEHPGLGGSIDTMLARMNEPYRRLAIESIELDGVEPSFAGLRASAQTQVNDGALVSVAVIYDRVDEALLASVRSILAQTYQNWELLLVGASPSAALKKLASSDARIRLVSIVKSADPRSLRNEALQTATGEYFTLQGAASWAHPHRLEAQVYDLTANPSRIANTVHGLTVSERLDFVTGAGAALAMSDSTLLFHRSTALEVVGYFDASSPIIDIDYRTRLEAASKTTVEALVPGAPLIFDLESETNAPSTGVWHPFAKLAALSAESYRAKLIETGELDPHVDISGPGAPVDSPSDAHFDIIVVLDGRELSSRRRFLRAVVAEVRAARAAGKSVALVQSYSMLGPRANAKFPTDLQGLISRGDVTLLADDADADARTVIVRHAGAAQGHPAEKRAITAERVVVVEDTRAGDERGRTIASSDVIGTVSAWFGKAPEWAIALPEMPVATVSAVAFDASGLRLMISDSSPERIRRVRVINGETTVTLTPTVVSAELVAAADPSGEFVAGEWKVVLETDAGGGILVDQACPISPDVVIWNSQDNVAVRVANGEALRLLPDRSSDDALSSVEFSRKYLIASVTEAKADQGRFVLAIDGKNASPLTGVYALREVDGGVVRRRDFTAATETGQKTWRRTLAKFAGSRWRLFGSFQTPLGRVEFPLVLDATATTAGTRDWQPQVLSGGRIFIAPPVPGRIASVGQRVSKAAQGAVIEPAWKALRTIAPRGGTKDRIVFGPQHAVSRLASAPTVSMVMPVYNVEPYLDVAISSVLDQDFADLELIIVDDASTDNGRAIIEKYWKKDKRVRVFGLDHNTLGGAGIPSNVGIRAALGTYVAFADSDDHVTRDGLAMLVASAQSNKADLAVGDFRTFTAEDATGTESYDRAVWADLPVGEVISAASNPDLFRLSPVPWRKLYRREFLQEHDILYPEGDYFYEDNPLHWFVLSRAERVVLCDTVVSFHRMEREGQTMSAQTYKLGAFVNHANTTMRFLEGAKGANRTALFEAFIGYLDRTHWTATRQSQPVASALVKRGFGEVYRKSVAAAPGVKLSPRTKTKMAEDQAAYPDVDLTIVIPVFNNADLVSGTIDSLLTLRGISFNVLLVDDGSTDDSLAVMQGYESRHSNVHVFAQGNRGAGRARNSVIPLATGRYTYFLDADDHIDSRSLAAAVRHADATSADLVFVKYRIDYVDEGRTRGMFDADRDLWKQAESAKTGPEKENLAVRLINYPWNRIIRTTLLHDANIFFGATIVHNDVLFHWHSIVSANAIEFFDVEVCVHKKFAVRQQVTNVNDGRRMAVLEALRDTHSRISHLDHYSDVREEWQKFAAHLLTWAQERIPADLQSEYARRRAQLTASFEQN